MTKLEILQTIMTSLRTDLPQILLDSGLQNFDEYEVGDPTTPEVLALSCYYGNSSNNQSVDNTGIVVQAQYYQIGYIDSLKYSQIIKDYLLNYDPEKIGFQNLDRLEDEDFPPQDTGATFSFFYLTYLNELDDC